MMRNTIKTALSKIKTIGTVKAKRVTAYCQKLIRGDYTSSGSLSAKCSVCSVRYRQLLPFGVVRTIISYLIKQEVATVIIIDPVLVLLFAFWLVFLMTLIIFLAGS